MEGETRRVSAQLHTASSRSSRVVRDRKSIEAVVVVSGIGKLILSVNSAGGYSLRAEWEGEKASNRNLLTVGVLRSDGVVSVLPEGVRLAADESD